MTNKQTIQKKYFDLISSGHYIDVQSKDAQWKIAKVIDRDKRLIYVIYDGYSKKQQQFYIGSNRVAPLRSNTIGFTGYAFKISRNNMPAVVDLKNYLQIVQQKCLKQQKSQAFDITQMLRGQIFVYVHDLLCKQYSLSQNEVKQTNNFLYQFLLFVVQILQLSKNYSQQYFNQSSNANKLFYLVNNKIALIQSVQQLLILLELIFKTDNFKFITLFKYNKQIVTQIKLMQFFAESKGINKLYDIFMLNDKNGKWYPSTVRKSIYKILIAYTNTNLKNKSVMPTLPTYLMKDYQQFYSIMTCMIKYNPQITFENQFIQFSLKIIISTNSAFDAKLKSIQQIKKILQGKTKFQNVDKNKLMAKVDQYNVLDHLLNANNFNPQVFKRFIPILSLFSKYKALNLKQVNSLFQILKNCHQSETQMIFQIISQLSQFAPSSLLDHIFTQICKININEQQTLRFIKTFTIKAVQNLSKQKSFTLSSFFTRKKNASSKHGNYGLNLLFKQISDDGKIIKSKMLFTLNIIRDILQQKIFQQERWNYLIHTIQFIKKKKNFGQSIKLITLILQTFEDQAFFGQTRKKVVQRLQTKYSLIQNIVEGLKNLQKIIQTKISHQQSLTLFYELIQQFSLYIKNPLKVKQIQYLWYKFNSNDKLLNFLRKPRKITERYPKMLYPEIIQQIFEKIFKKSNFYKRKLTYKQFQAVYEIFISYHLERQNIEVPTKDQIVRYNKNNLLGFQYFQNFLQAAAFEEQFQKACKKTIQIKIRPIFNKKDKMQNDQILQQEKVLVWIQLFKNCVQKLVLNPKKCLLFIQLFYTSIQGRMYKDINFNDHSYVTILIQNDMNQIKQITIEKFSTIFRLRKLIKQKFKLKNDFAMFNTNLNRYLTFQQEQDYSINAMPLSTNKNIPTIKIQLKNKKYHHQERIILLFKKIIQNQQKLYSQIFSIIENNQINQQIENLFWKVIDLLPYNKSMLSQIQKCQGFTIQKWSEYFKSHSQNSLQYKINMIFTLMKQSQKWANKMYQKGGLQATINLLLQKLKIWQFKLQNEILSIKIINIILKLFEKSNKKQLNLELIKNANESLIKVLQNEFKNKQQVCFKQNNNIKSQIPLNFINNSLQFYLTSLKKINQNSLNDKNNKQLQLKKLLSIKSYCDILNYGLFRQKNQDSQRFSEQISISIVFNIFNTVQDKIIIVQNLLVKLNVQQLLLKQRCQNYFKFIITVLYSIQDEQNNFNQNNKNQQIINILTIFSKIQNFIYSVLEYEIIKNVDIKKFQQVINGILNLLKFLLSKSTDQKDLTYYKIDYQKVYIKLVNNFLFPLKYQSQKKLKNQKNKKILFDILKKITFIKPKLAQIIIEKRKQFLQKNKHRKNKIMNWNLHFQKNQKKYFVGLKNLGATCYINCLFQQLFMIKDFRQNFIEIDSRSYNKQLQKNEIYQLQNIFYSLKYGDQKYQITKKFCDSFITYQGQPINPMIQSDADQFFNTLMQRVQNFLKQTNKHEILEKTFQGKLSNQLICQDCPHRSQKIQSFMSIGVNLKNKKTLQQALKGYVQGQILDGNNSYFCQPCQKKVKTLKRLCIKQLPKILVIVLKRFQYDFDTYRKVKINSYLQFPEKIDMAKYTSDHLETLNFQKQENLKNIESSLKNNQNSIINDDSNFKHNQNNSSIFKLRGSVIHAGIADAGHYYSFIKDNQKWYEFNDDYINEINDNKVKQQGFGGQQKQDQFKMQKFKNAYILFYERQSPQLLKQQKLLKEDIGDQQKQMENSLNEQKQTFYQLMKNNIILQNSESTMFSILMQQQFIHFWQNLSIINNVEIIKFIFLYFHTVILRDRQRYDYASAYYRILISYLNKNKQSKQNSINQHKQNNQMTISQWFLSQIDTNYMKQFLIQAPKSVRLMCIGLVLTAIQQTTQISQKMIKDAILSLRKNGMSPFGLIFKALAKKQKCRKYLQQIKFSQIIVSLITNQKSIEDQPQLLSIKSSSIKQQSSSYFGQQCSQQSLQKQKCSAALLQSLQHFNLDQSTLIKLIQKYHYRSSNKIMNKKLVKLLYNQILTNEKKSLIEQNISGITLRMNSYQDKLINFSYQKDQCQKYFFFLRYLILCLHDKQILNIQVKSQYQTNQKTYLETLQKQIYKLTIQSFDKFILSTNMNQPMDFVLREITKIAYKDIKFRHQWRMNFYKNKKIQQKIQDWFKQIQKPQYLNPKDDFFQNLKSMNMIEKAKYLKNYIYQMKQKIDWMYVTDQVSNKQLQQQNKLIQQISDLQDAEQNKIIKIRNKSFKIKQKIGQGIIYNVSYLSKENNSTWAYLQKNQIQTLNNL